MIARNNFSRTDDALHTAANWNEHETLTTDAPHTYNFGYVEKIGGPDNTSVSLWPSEGHHWMFPPVGATLLVLGGPGAGQTRLVTGVNATGVNACATTCLDASITASGARSDCLRSLVADTLERPFDLHLVPNASKVVAVPVRIRESNLQNL